jgi:VanZ family protein
MNNTRNRRWRDAWHTAIMIMWVVVIYCVIVGELLPAASPVMVDISRLQINDKVEHVSDYLALSLVPVVGFRDWRRGIVAALSMFALGVVLEGLQHCSAGHCVELGDVIANGIGVSCGALLGWPIRAGIAASP